MSITLATKGIIFVSAPRDISGLNPIPVCEPDIISYEYGEKHMKGIEMIPEIKAKRRVRYEKKYLE